MVNLSNEIVAQPRRWLKRRSTVEAVVGHSKNECRLAKNYLLGVEGDKINAILCGCGYNIHGLLRFFIFGFTEFSFLNGPIAQPTWQSLFKTNFGRLF
ncbi:MAG: hypothetical protein ACYTBX_18895 [Planctomycetota bacterium]